MDANHGFLYERVIRGPNSEGALMKRMRGWCGRLAVALACAGWAGAGHAEELAVQSFNGSGQLVFSTLNSATNYRVEWASYPSGPWTNFTFGAGARLDYIPASQAGSITCSVPVFYRVVAVTNTPPAPEGMVLIPAGTNSGTDPDFGAYSLTNVTGFYMDTTEVTKAQWDAVYAWAAAHGYTFSNAGSGKAADHPVQTVNWYDCVTWCNARSEKEGRTPCYNLSTWACDFAANGYRLPTITEWEYAARGGASGRRFPWGDTIDHSQANYHGYPQYNTYDLGYEGFDTRYATGDPYTSPVGSFAANGYGLYDMAGNVWEWCNDPAGSIHGGCWDSDAYSARCGYSRWGDPVYAGNLHGFRSVCR